MDWETCYVLLYNKEILKFLYFVIKILRYKFQTLTQFSLFLEQF